MRIPIILTALSLASVMIACGQTKSNPIAEDQKMPANTGPIPKNEAEWKKKLSNEQYYVLRQKGTEAPFTGKLLLNKEKGVYKCAGCGNELFTDEMKFDSHCGWPSFDKEISGGKIKTVKDESHGMSRTEIMCAKCGGHLGHLFDDGPTATGMRYCVNSLSLEFVAENQNEIIETKSTAKIDTITLGGGCFWCVEAVYEMLKGVINVESGYSGGSTVNPSYTEVCTGATGNAEAVQITYDNTITNLNEIYKVFFSIHDPTTLNRQGADVGTQYRSVIFYRNASQQKEAKEIIDALNKDNIYGRPVVTQLEAFASFYKAEDYHQNYYNSNKEERYCRLVIQPKIEKFEKLFKDRIK